MSSQFDFHFMPSRLNKFLHQIVSSRETQYFCRETSGATNPHIQDYHRSPESLSSHLHKLDDISAALIVRRESPWDTYLPAITYDIAGQVVIAARRTRPSREVAIRKYQRQDAKGLIEEFGRLEHTNLLSVREC